MISKKYLPWVVALGFAFLYLSTFFAKDQQPPPAQPSTFPSASPTSNTPDFSSLYLVTRVVDGDTIELENKTKVRYIGIDTPETGVCFANHAKAANSNLVLNKKVKLEYNVQRLDKYGRTLAYVYIEDIFVNEQLVLDGFAKVSTYPPNVAFVDKFKAAERIARNNKIGLWSADACKTEQTSDIGENVSVLSNTTNIECNIKGNINSQGEKIYHVQGQRYYDKTQIDETAGERWFCLETEAENAGWRKSKL